MDYDAKSLYSLNSGWKGNYYDANSNPQCNT